jgi:hypothetical protein
MELALSLSSSFAIFYPTPWIDKAWTWRNFSLMRWESTNQLCISKRFWSVVEAPRHTNKIMPSKFWKVMRHKNQTLIRLGFALTELALGKRLPDIRAERRGKEEALEPQSDWMEDLNDFETAMDLVDKGIIRQETGESYHGVVTACLHCEVFDNDRMRALGSESSLFAEDFEEFVVAPLRNYLWNTWGHGAISPG